MPVAGDKTVGFAFHGNCVIYVGAKKPPTDAAWDLYIENLAKHFNSVGKGGKVKSVVVERGPGPTAKQRASLQNATKDWDLSVAIVEKSAFVRGIVTALTWFKPGYKAFPPQDLDAALIFVGIPSATTPDIKKSIQQLEKELDTPSSSAA